MKNYYEILEVNEKASQDTISKVFKMHMKKWHPDLYQGEEKIIAENKTKELSEAYNILSDENKRKEYDTELSQQNLTTNYEIENLRQENEMLKKDIEKRNLIISNLINPSSETYKKIILCILNLFASIILTTILILIVITTTMIIITIKKNMKQKITIMFINKDFITMP